MLTFSDPRVPAIPGGWQRHPGAAAGRRLHVLLQQHGNLQERGHNLTFKTVFNTITRRHIKSIHVESFVIQEYEELVESSQQYQHLDNPIYRVCIERASNAGVKV